MGHVDEDILREKLKLGMSYDDAKASAWVDETEKERDIPMPRFVGKKKSKDESLLDYVEPVRMNMPKKKDVARLLDLV